jgi:phosphohistidine swiveling domain-containing protein
MARQRQVRLFTLMDVAVEGGRLEEFGSRAIALVEARRRGAPVVESWVVPAAGFRELVHNELPPGHDPASLLRSIHKPLGLERAARARERLLGMKLPAELCDELAALTAAEPAPEWGFVVRASPTIADDSVVHSAGLDTVVAGVRDAGELATAICRVWADALLEDALRFLRARRVRDFAVAAVIQRCDALLASGILLTRESAWGTREESSVLGAALGFAVQHPQAAGALDVARLAPDGQVIAQRIAHKRQRLIMTEQGPELVASERAAADAPAIGPEILAALSPIATQLGADGARAIELGVFVDGLRVLDVQRASGLGFPAGGDASTVWSRSGLGELLPGVPTPLTASLAEAFCEAGLRRAFLTLGVKVSKNAHLVERVTGRFYFNLSALVPATADVPGVDPSALLDLVRGADPSRLVRELELTPRRARLARVPFMLARLGSLERRLAEEVGRFERDADVHRGWLSELDLGILPDDSLKTTLLESQQFFVGTGRLMLSCTLAALAAHLGLKSVLARSLSGRAEQLAQALTSGVGDLDSAAPGIALSHVAAICAKDAAARQALLAGRLHDPSELPPGAGRRALGQFLDAYGDRAIREAELTTPRWSEQPEPVLAMLTALLASDPVDPERRLSAVRVRADRELALLEATIPYLDRLLVLALIRRARALTRLREKMRVWMARTLAMMRIVTLDVDRRLRRLDSTLRQDAAFFLTFGELVSAVGNMRADLAPLVRSRRAAFARDTSRPDPPETFLGIPPRLVVPHTDGPALRGAASSPGVAVGPVRLVGRHGEGASHARPGEVLVLRSPDAGLSPLFLGAAAVVAELGGTLSHGAVIAREYGLQAVTGVSGVLAAVRDGDRLRVDGDRGIVEQVEG